MSCEQRSRSGGCKGFAVTLPDRIAMQYRRGSGCKRQGLILRGIAVDERLDAGLR